jgi:hypothetical protein
MGWDLATYQCLATFRGDTGFTAVAATTTTICAGDFAHTLWFFDWPPSWMPQLLELESRPEPRLPKVTTSRLGIWGPRVASNVTLFLAANPSNTSELALDKECAAIQSVLRGAHRDYDF